MHKYISYSIITSAITFLLFWGVFAPKSFAQQLEFDEVTVIAPFEPSISDAFKINFNPGIEDTLQADFNFDYRIFPRQIPVRFNMEPLSAARMRGEPLAKLYKGYARAGIGNYTTPFAEVFYNSLRSNDYHYGVHVKHRSSAGKIDGYGNSGYSDNLINLYGKRFLRNHTLHADVTYDRNMVHFYGFSPDSVNLPDLTSKDYRQRYHFVSPSIGIRSNFLDSTKLQHSIDFGYQFLREGFDGASEHQLGLSASLGKTLGDDPMGLADSQAFHLDFAADYYNTLTAADTANTALISLTPRFSSAIGDFRFYVGIDASIQADTTSYVRFYPLAGAEVSLISNVLYAYASLSGGLTKNNIRDFMLVNPFMQTAIPYAFTNKKSEIRGGLKGSISAIASYNISISNSNYTDYPFFVTDFSTPAEGPDLKNRFEVIYDNVRLFNLRTEVFSNVGERFKLRLSSDYYEYATDQEIQAWHKPSMEIGLDLTYNIQDKIIFNAGAKSRNRIYARVPDTENPGAFKRQKINNFHVDANLGIEYRYTKILSVFIHLNNLSNQPFERWYNYPTQQFNVLGGVTYAF